MKLLYATLVLMLALPTWASERYPSLDAAALAALDDALAREPAHHEWAGALWEDTDGLFYYSEPQTSGKTHSVSVRIRKPASARLAGIYHTHPDGVDSHLFSAHDLEIAKQLGVPSYIGTSDGVVRIYIHGEHYRIRAGRRAGQFHSRGAVVSRTSAGLVEKDSILLACESATLELKSYHLMACSFEDGGESCVRMPFMGRRTDKEGDTASLYTWTNTEAGVHWTLFVYRLSAAKASIMFTIHETESGGLVRKGTTTEECNVMETAI